MVKGKYCTVAFVPPDFFWAIKEFWPLNQQDAQSSVGKVEKVNQQWQVQQLFQYNFNCSDDSFHAIYLPNYWAIRDWLMFNE